MIKKSGHKWTYINSFYKKSCSLPDSRPALPCPWTCRAAPWWTSPAWWCLRASPRCLPTSALLQLCPWWYPVSRSCQTKKEWKGRMNGAILALVTCTWYNLKGKSICTIANLILLAFSCNQIHLPTTHYTYKIFQDYFYKIIIFFTCVKTAGLPCSNISSNSSLVVVRPAEQKDLVLTGSWFLSSNREENILNRFSLNRLIWFLSSNIEEYILNSQFLGSDINFSAASSTRN